MILLETLAVSLGLFSRLPLPQPQWTKQNMRFALCAFPLVGIVIALALFGWAALCGLLSAPPLLRGAGFCLLPVWITGGIHLDGYADTCDALSSCASMAKKQEILQDPHCGSFAVIRLCCYFLSSFVLCCTLVSNTRSMLCFGLSFVLSRCLSALAVARFPLAKQSGLAHSFASAADKKTVRIVLMVLAVSSIGALCFFGQRTGLLISLSALAVFAYYAHLTKSQFGGLSGDLAGWFLQQAELFMLAALIACQLMEGLL